MRLKRTTTDKPTAPSEQLWDPRAGAGGRAKYLGVRWSVFAIIALAGAALIAGSFRPVYQTVNMVADHTTVSTIGQYASAFVTDWFTWDEDDRDDYNARLSVYNPELTRPGWDGRGKQRVVQAHVFNMEERNDGSYVVTVRVQVDTSPAAFYVQVRTRGSEDGVGVISAPALVPAPRLLAEYVAPLPTTTEPDTEVVDAINSQVRLFLNAWASNDESLSQFVLDGVDIPAMGGGVQLAAVDPAAVPAVEPGHDPNQRTVIVPVTWQWPAGGTVPTHYRISLQRTSGKWFVTEVEGGVADARIAPPGGTPPAPEPSNTPQAPSGDDDEVSTGSEGSAPSPPEHTAPGDEATVESPGLIEDPPFGP